MYADSLSQCSLTFFSERATIMRTISTYSIDVRTESSREPLSLSPSDFWFQENPWIKINSTGNPAQNISSSETCSSTNLVILCLMVTKSQRDASPKTFDFLSALKHERCRLAETVSTQWKWMEMDAWELKNDEKVPYILLIKTWSWKSIALFLCLQREWRKRVLYLPSSVHQPQ